MNEKRNIPQKILMRRLRAEQRGESTEGFPVRIRHIKPNKAYLHVEPTNVDLALTEQWLKDQGIET